MMYLVVVPILLFLNTVLYGENTIRINPRADNYLCRVIAANQMTANLAPYDITTELNADQSVAPYAGSFTKSLQHDAVTGLLNASGQENFQALVHAIETADQVNFNEIVRAIGASIQFKNPQGAYAHSLVGAPCAIIPIAPAPTISSPEAAADIIENYLHAICRSVAFDEYGTGEGTDVDTVNGGSITNNAAAILTALGDAYQGPKVDGEVTAGVLFRGNAVGDLVGPYISQFWWLPLHRNYTAYEEPQYFSIAQDREFGVTWDDFIDIENGIVPVPYEPSDFSGYRYIIDGRDVGTAVHNDPPAIFFFDAVNILLYNRFPQASNLPYFNGDMPNECQFVTMGIADIDAAIFTAAQEGLKNAWAHKWLGSRKVRPEAMAGLVHRAKVTDTNPFDLYETIFEELAGIDLLAWVKEYNSQQGEGADTYLLAQQYPEGSPDHPSYPAGHATFSSASATIVKAFFDDTELIATYTAPVKPDPSDPTKLVPLSEEEGALLLTVGGELDKLASNIAIARDFAGVHYRSDAEASVVLGEQVGLKVLQNWAAIYHEQDFTGFELTLRNGQRVRVTKDGVTNILS
ncbi:MAG TPA: vanadium-dependent haloperoxidase [Candidatus Dependentiae bacterium]|nr:vanadium-dependent haloperoxidase [Candidatus Dependentiae bacterium]HRQ63189.1 vanadium-dependent haloperoxidase [Candidatus Dependentiae bacterium]